VGVCLPGRIVGSLEGLAVGAPVEAPFTELDGELIGPVWTLTGDEAEDVVGETAEDRHTAREVDAIVVGAGFGGIQMAHELTQLGLSVQLIEAGPCVGGVWSWNRYPGARTDIESYQYCFSFSEELWQEWQWTERYPSQPEVLAYLQFAARRLGVGRYMQFNSRVEAATYDEDTDRWTVVTDGAETLGCRFLVWRPVVCLDPSTRRSRVSSPSRVAGTRLPAGPAKTLISPASGSASSVWARPAYSSFRSSRNKPRT
jgi:hypothetical protein